MCIVRQKIQPFALHRAATAARNAPHFQFQNNPKSCARQVPNMPHPSVVPPLLRVPAAPADGFFERRSSRTIRTFGSPNTPRTVALDRKPANEYPSDRRRCRFPDLPMPQHAKIEPKQKREKSPIHKRFRRYDPSKSPTQFPEDPEKIAVESRGDQIRRNGWAMGHLLQARAELT